MIKFSIITVSYNSEKTIAETIQSVKDQSFKSYEHLIIDGSSTDKTCKIINSCKHEKMTWISEVDNGLYDAMNKGLLLAAGEYVVFLNSDDVFCDEYVLEKVHNASQTSPDFIYGGISYFSGSKKDIRVWLPELFDDIKRKKLQLPHPSIFIKRKQLIDSNRFFDVNYKVAADLKQQLEIIHLDNRIGLGLKEVLVYMRLGGKSTDGFSAFVFGWKESAQVYFNLFGFIGIYYFLRKVLYKLPQVKKISFLLTR